MVALLPRVGDRSMGRESIGQLVERRLLVCFDCRHVHHSSRKYEFAPFYLSPTHNILPFTPLVVKLVVCISLQVSSWGLGHAVNVKGPSHSSPEHSLLPVKDDHRIIFDW
jgi:hypothetical protein